MRWSSAWGVPAAGEDGTLMVVGDGERWLGFIIIYLLLSGGSKR